MRLFIRLACLWPAAALNRLHLEWALREIDPMHPDVHYIVHKLRELEA